MSKANMENIKKTITNFNWNEAFENLSIDWKVEPVDEALLNIFRNDIPIKKIKCDYHQPTWMTQNFKKSLKERAKWTKYYDRNVKKKEYW